MRFNCSSAQMSREGVERHNRHRGKDSDARTQRFHGRARRHQSRPLLRWKRFPRQRTPRVSLFRFSSGHHCRYVPPSPPSFSRHRAKCARCRERVPPHENEKYKCAAVGGHPWAAGEREFDGKLFVSGTAPAGNPPLFDYASPCGSAIRNEASLLASENGARTGEEELR